MLDKRCICLLGRWASFLTWRVPSACAGADGAANRKRPLANIQRPRARQRCAVRAMKHLKRCIANYNYSNYSRLTENNRPKTRSPFGLFEAKGVQKNVDAWKMLYVLIKFENCPQYPWNSIMRTWLGDIETTSKVYLFNNCLKLKKYFLTAKEFCLLSSA